MTRLLALFQKLSSACGPTGWWPAETRLEMMMGAVLVQAVSWTGAERALDRLRSKGALTLPGFFALPEDELLWCLKPTRFYRAKATRLRRLLDAVWAAGGVEAYLAGDTEDCRRELLAISGIGPETADAILLYAGGRPVFMVDGYTRRVGSRWGLFPDVASYEAMQSFFERRLKDHQAEWGEFHGLIVELAKRWCHKSRPACETCPCAPLCPKREVAGACEKEVSYAEQDARNVQTP